MSDTGWLDHGTFYNDDYGGGPAWTDLTDAVSENAAYASVDIVDEDETDWLRGQNITESIPDDATIKGVEVRIKWYKGGVPDGVLWALYLHQNGTITGGSQSSFENLPSSNGWSITFGGPTDMWGSGVSTADVKASDFGVKLVLGSSGTQTLYVDCVQIKIYYDEYLFHPMPSHYRVP